MMKLMAIAATAGALMLGVPSAKAETCMIKGEIPVPCGGNYSAPPVYRGPVYAAPSYGGPVYDENAYDDYYGDAPYDDGYYGGYPSYGPSLSFGFGGFGGGHHHGGGGHHWHHRH